MGCRRSGDGGWTRCGNPTRNCDSLQPRGRRGDRTDTGCGSAEGQCRRSSRYPRQGGGWSHARGARARSPPMRPAEPVGIAGTAPRDARRTFRVRGVGTPEPAGIHMPHVHRRRPPRRPLIVMWAPKPHCCTDPCRAPDPQWRGRGVASGWSAAGSLAPVGIGSRAWVRPADRTKPKQAGNSDAWGSLGGRRPPIYAAYAQRIRWEGKP